MNKKKKLTNNAGAPVAHNNNVMTAGKRGPMLLQDVWYLEKLAQFDREVIPERRMHAKGSGAYGTFTVTHDITRYTKADIFSKVGKKTEMFARFSTVAGERGAADAERDIRGFAMKFYTDEGNWDLVGNNTPVFFLRDPLKFPDLNHVVKRDPRTNLRSALNNWDFWTSLPEALHQVTITMGDRGIPYSYRHMHGFGSHTYSMINAKNQRFWVKFHLKTQQGIKNLTDAEAEAVIGKCRESNQRDLYYSIEKGDFPRWTMFIQVVPEKDAAKFPFNPFDLTKVWPHKDYPLVEVGVMELNRNPENFRGGRAGGVQSGQHRAGHRVLPTRCSRAGCFRTGMRSATAWASITTSSRSTVRVVRSTATTGTAPCGSTATTAARWGMSRTATASGRNSPSSPNRPSPSKARPTTTISGKTMMTTTRSRGRCSASWARMNSSACSRTPRAPWAIVPAKSRSATSATASRPTRPMAKASPRR